VDFRTISLVTHASKIMLKITARRLEGKAEAYLGNVQFGFRRGRRTRDGTAAVRTLAERSVEHNIKCFTYAMWIMKKLSIESIGLK